MATPRLPTNPPTTQAPASIRQGSATASTTTTGTIRTTPSNAASTATATTTTMVATRPTPSNAAPSATATTTATVANRPIPSSAVPSGAETTTSTTRTTPPTATSSAPAAASSNTTTTPAAGTSESQKPTNAAQADLQKVSLVSTKSQFDIKISEAGNKLVIVEFFAQWCGPCKIISNKLEELAGKYENQAIVLKLDVDDCEDIAMEYNVTSMPTFVFLRNKKKINELIGSSDEKLFESVDKLCNEVNSTPEFSQPTTSATNVEIRIKKTAHLSAKPAVK